MAYCTQADILEQLDSDILIELTDDAGTGTVDTDVVTRAIDDADSVIDGYAGSRYSVPFETVPTLIRKISVDLSICNLFSRRRGSPEWIETRCKDGIAMLRDVSAGKVSLGEDDPDGTPSEYHMPSITSATRVFSRSKMTGW